MAVPTFPAKAGSAKAAAKGGGGGGSPPATSATVCRLRDATGKCKWGDGCKFAHAATNDDQKKAVAKYFVKHAESNVVAAPVTPKAKESAPAQKAEAKGKGKGRSQSRELRDRAKKSPRWHFHLGSGCSHGDKHHCLHTASNAEEAETVRQCKASSPTQPVAKPREASKSREPNGGAPGSKKECLAYKEKGVCSCGNRCKFLHSTVGVPCVLLPLACAEIVETSYGCTGSVDFEGFGMRQPSPESRPVADARVRECYGHTDPVDLAGFSAKYAMFTSNARSDADCSQTEVCCAREPVATIEHRCAGAVKFARARSADAQFDANRPALEDLLPLPWESRAGICDSRTPLERCASVVRLT
jgi:hypothetical protein